MAEPVIIKKKKVVGGHGHHGGSWKVAYADFVTAMMAFFMVMWIMGLSDDTRTKVQGYFNDPLGFNRQTPRSRAIIAMNGKPGRPSKKAKSGAVRPAVPGSGPGAGDNAGKLEGMKEKIAAILAKDTAFKDLSKHIEIHDGPEGVRIEFKEATTPVFFKSGSHELQPAALVIIKTIAPVLAEENCHIRVEGHTDAKPYAGDGYTNDDLSSDRAKALYHALLDDGVRYQQMQGFMGYADRRLRDKANPFNPANRRVSILIPYEVSKGILGGKDKEPKPELTKKVVIKPAIVDLHTQPIGESGLRRVQKLDE